MRRKVIIDTDPGIDDAIAIAIALNSHEIDVQLLTTVSGNVDIENVTRNTLSLVEFFGKDIKVAKGSSEPLVEKAVFATNVHGKTGLEGYDFPAPDFNKLCEDHAVVEMQRLIINSEQPVTIVAIGPLTNIALLLKMYPEVKTNIEELILMGGSLTRGNKGVNSEFNIAVDPEAAKIVFNSGLKIAVAPLDVGLKALVYPTDSEQIKTFNKSGDMMYQLFKKYRGGSFNTGLKMYDACAIGYLLKPEMFNIEHVFIDVDTNYGYSKGNTVIDVKGYLNQAANAYVCTDIDEEIFKEWFIEAIKKCN